jgi:signal transduction histidine kinase/CheY-like chemotaxis protein/tetratricopeptide (TPR) repeat protein
MDQQERETKPACAGVVQGVANSSPLRCVPETPLPAVFSARGPAGGRLFGGRYRVVRSLKKAHGVETLAATDLEGGEAVVIKATSGESLSPAARMRLEHEAQVLRQIRSPWFAPLLHAGREGDLYYLVMPLLPGVTLEQRLRRGPLALAEALTVGRCLFSALCAAHGHGVLHRDLKPANIIVDDGAPLRRATIIDFGLARSACLDASLRDLPVGTARYMSPEQAGLLDENVDERSDLYAAGVVLFECLAGRPPFEAASVGEVLRQHLSARPPELRSLGVVVPRALDEVVQHLLRKDPRDRYQSGEAVVADLEEIAEALERGVAEPALVVGRHDHRRTLTEPAFVGRGEQLSALEARLGRTAEGHGGLVLLEAASGGGKTRLLAELAQRAVRQGVWVLRGQGLDQVGQRPFQALSGVVEALADTAHREPALAEAIRRRLGDHLQAACAALPELADALSVRGLLARRASEGMDNELGPETFGQARSLEALAVLLDALGAEGRPVLVLLDDCQWFDELTLKLIARWRRRGQGKPSHLLLVAAFRSEDVPAGHLLRGVRPALQLALPAFEAADVRLLAESMAGPLPDEALEVVQRFCEGSPFMAVAVLQGLVESGALVQGPSGWRVEAQALADIQSSRHAAAFLARRLELLPPPALRLLSVAAVLGKEFDLPLAAVLADQTPAEAIAALDEARRRHIVWQRPPDGRSAFIHDKLRQTLLERLPEAERRRLHLRAALELERQPSPCVFSLAYHFDAAGDSGRALPYALAAAEQARAQHSLEIAAQQYRIAERGTVSPTRQRGNHKPEAQALDTPDQTRGRVAEGFGDVLMLQGRYDEAQEQLEKANGFSSDNVVRARVAGKLGELSFKRGDMETAIGFLESGLGLLGKPVPRAAPVFLLLTLWEALVQVLHTLLPALFLARRPLEGADTERLVIRLYSRLAYAYWFERGRLRTLWAHLREMNRAERYPPTPELAQAYSEHGPGMSLFAWTRRGIAYVEKSLDIRRARGDLWGQGQSLHFYGVVLYAASRYAECIEKCGEAVRLLRRTGDFWEVNIARYQIAASLYRLGDLRAALEEARAIHQSGCDLGDGQAAGISLDVWAWASGGRVPAEVVRVEKDRPSPDAQRTAQVLVADGVRLLGEGRPADAAAALEQARRVVYEADVRNAWVSPVLPWLATARRRHLESLTDRTPRRRAALLRSLRAAVRQALRWARRFRNDLPHALREAALLAAMEGKPRRARRLFAESLTQAAHQGARCEYAQSLLARGQVGLELGWPGAAENVAEAEQSLLQMMNDDCGMTKESGGKPSCSSSMHPSSFRIHPSREPVTLSLADRFDGVLDVGRRIASALTREAVVEAVRDAGVRLLRGEHCLVVDVGRNASEGESAVDSSQVKAEYSRAMVRQAVATGRAVAFVEGLPDSTSESLLLSGARSSLCAPIFLRGRPVGCLYVTHSQVGRLFGPDEERLADFIAALAGAALENATHFAELRRLNETLELRMREREQAEAEKKKFEAQFLRAQRMESIGTLAGGIAHDLNNMLTPILMAVELLKSPLPEEARRDLLGTIEESTERGAEMVRQILSFARGAEGRRVLVQVRHLIRDLEKVIGSALPKSIAVDVRLPRDLWTLSGDPTQLYQVLMNLCVNARDAMPDGGRLTLAAENKRLDEAAARAHPDVRPGPYVLLRVADTGTGIPPAILDRIFDPFFTTKEIGKGTGLGLSTVLGIVRGHGGFVTVSSEVGRGTEFCIYLPAAETSAAACGEEEGPQECSGRGELILVVDDEAAIRELARATLTANGYRVQTAREGTEAVALYARLREEVRLVLTDMMMPVMDGPATIRALRQLSPEVRILATSGLGVAAAVGQADAFLPKPYAPHDLLGAVRQMLDRQPAAANAP